MTSARPLRLTRVGSLLLALALVPLLALSVLTISRFSTLNEARDGLEHLETQADQLVALTELEASLQDEKRWRLGILSIEDLDIPVGLATMVSGLDFRASVAEASTSVDQTLARLDLPEIEARIRSARSDELPLAELSRRYDEAAMAIRAELQDAIRRVNGLGAQLNAGGHVLVAACRQLDDWSDHPILSKLPVSINISGRHLTAGSLCDEVTSQLKHWSVEPERLIVEITENALLDDINSAARPLDDLRANGVRVAIDDFGTGYTSLSHLRNLRVDILKIDRSFTAGLDSVDDLSLVKLMIVTSHLLGVSVTAEGVEEERQASILRALGAKTLQGYMYAKPVPATDLAATVIRLNTLSSDVSKFSDKGHFGPLPPISSLRT